MRRRRPTTRLLSYAFLLLVFGVLVAHPRAGRGAEFVALLKGIARTIAVSAPIIALFVLVGYWRERRAQARVRGMPQPVVAEVEGQSVSIMPGEYAIDGQPTPAGLEFARRLVGQVGEMRRRAAEELLGAYNDGWRSDDAPVLDAEEFGAGLGAPSILLLDEGGSATVSFAPPDMFGEHEVTVFVLDGQIVDVSIEG